MAPKLDPTVVTMLRRLQDEFNNEIAGNRPGPIVNAVLPLSAALVQKQKRIEDLTRQRDRMAQWISEALLKLEEHVDVEDEAAAMFIGRGKFMAAWSTGEER